jgi:hypothetical protein
MIPLTNEPGKFKEHDEPMKPFGTKVLETASVKQKFLAVCILNWST